MSEGDNRHASDSPGAAKPPASSVDDATTETRERDALGLSRGDVRFVLACGTAILLLLGAHWLQRGWSGAQLVEIDRLPVKAYEFRLDINSATWVEWMQLDGIGEVLARRIVDHRKQFGPFARIDDLTRVPGVGPQTLEQLRPHLTCTDCLQPADAP